MTAGRPDPGRPAPCYDALAPGYDRLRPPDRNWWRVFEAIVAAVADEGGLAGVRVVDLGCGTGRLAHALAERGALVRGVDPSRAMLAEARARRLPGGGYERARAERLPFPAASFDAAVFRQSVHLVDRARAFREAARVLRPGGRVVVATFHPDHFSAVWVTRIFPRVAEIDRVRFPPEAELRTSLAEAGFDEPRVRRLVLESPLTREEALERIRGRFISTLHLLSGDELADGLARAERELPPEVPSTLDWLIVDAARS